MRWKRTIQLLDVHCEGEIGKVAIGVLVVVFLLLYVAPGDPVMSMVGERADQWLGNERHVPGYANYGRRRLGTGPMIELSGDVDADMARIRAFYADIVGRHPENATPAILPPPGTRQWTCGWATSVRPQVWSAAQAISLPYRTG